MATRRVRRKAVFCLMLALGLSTAGTPSPSHADGSPWQRVRDLARTLLPGAASDEYCELPGMVGGIAEPAAREVVIAPRKKAWEAALGGEVAARPHIRNRLMDWPTSLLVERATLPTSGRAFLARLARDTWNGLEAFTDREHHLPVDNVRFAPGSTSTTNGRVGDYTNVTSIGLRLIAIVAAHALDLISRDAALDRLRRLLATLASLETHRGFFYNYYDTTSLERTSNLLSFVDSSWLVAGLMVVRTSFTELAEPCTRLIDQIDFDFFYDAAAGRMTHGYYVQRAERSRYHYGVLYAESRLGSLIAIGKGDVPETHWFRMVRTFPAACSWQRQTPHALERKHVRGHALSSGHYAWRDARFVPSWGGSMFEALMPMLVVDERRHAAKSLGVNGAAHAEVQRRYALEVLGYPVWGMSPSSTPGGDDYAEYGVPVLGSLGYEPGAVTPHAAALALSVAPEAAIANLQTLVQSYDIYGTYGFYDAVEPRSGKVAYAYLALDQAMTFIAVANYLTDGTIQKRFASDPIAARALPILADEDFFQ